MLLHNSGTVLYNSPISIVLCHCDIWSTDTVSIFQHYNRKQYDLYEDSILFASFLINTNLDTFLFVSIGYVFLSS